MSEFLNPDPCKDLTVDFLIFIKNKPSQKNIEFKFKI